MTPHPRDPDWDGTPDPAVIANQLLTGEGRERPAVMGSPVRCTLPDTARRLAG